MVLQPSDTITASDLDDYLERGWFRFGGTMRTTRFTVWEERDLRTTLWTRTRLDGFTWSKSNRKLLARVRRTFRIEVGPALLDDEHEALYARYIAYVGGERPADLTDFLGGPEKMARFDTQSVRIYDEDRLVAFSLFDTGVKTLMSLLGAFDPDYAKSSLGYATLNLEIEHAMSTGMTHHYSGYVLPGEPRMDYKLRVGHMELLHPDTQEWLPWAAFDAILLPDQRMTAALDRIVHGLRSYGVEASRRLNPLFELSDNPSIEEQMVSEPMFAMVNRGPLPSPLVTWDDREQCFDLWSAIPAVIRHRRTADSVERTTPTALLQDHHGRFSIASDVVNELLPLLRR